MRRSYSSYSISSEPDPKITPYSQNVILTGSLSKRVQDTNSAAWNGLSLAVSHSTPEMRRKSPMRWKEYEQSKRTIDHSFEKTTDLRKNHSGLFKKSSTGNITDMINRGFSEDRLGKLSKKVVTKGKVLAKNATSFENKLISEGIAVVYKEIHTGHPSNEERRHKMSSAISEERKLSQISTLPGGHIEIFENKHQSRNVNSDHTSSIYAYFDGTRQESKILEVPNPCLKIFRNAATTYEKSTILGTGNERKGKKRHTLPERKDNKNYSKDLQARGSAKIA